MTEAKFVGRTNIQVYGNISDTTDTEPVHELKLPAIHS